MTERREGLWMSGKDRERLKVLHEVRKRHITQQQAGKELGISPRWVRALLNRVKREGDRAVVHRLRGRLSNRKLPAARKKRGFGFFPRHQKPKRGRDDGRGFAGEDRADDGGHKGGKE